MAEHLSNGRNHPRPAVPAAVPQAAAAGEAVDHLRRIFSLDPENIEAHERLKDIFVSQGREQEAENELLQLADRGKLNHTLMAMIRASHLQDGPGLTRLGEQVSCTRKAAR